MKRQATFIGFDFETVWTMEGHEDYLFPELQAVPMEFTASENPDDTPISFVDVPESAWYFDAVQYVV